MTDFFEEGEGVFFGHNPVFIFFFKCIVKIDFEISNLRLAYLHLAYNAYLINVILSALLICA